MERKTGEIFEHKGEWYQCVKGNECDECCFNNQKCYTLMGDDGEDIIDYCASDKRSDNVDIIFKKLEKVGEPFTCNYYGDDRLIIMQEYKSYDNRIVSTNGIPMYVTDEKHKRIAIEIKQNQEDMEENKLNMKPFNLEAAKAGKPVCTRGGHKARIICFDRKGYNQFPIIALIMNGDKGSDLYTYRPNGIWGNNGNESEKDLMMLPEKKEGWVNVYKERCYESKEEAVSCRAYNMECIDTIRVEWEE